jgi:parallel beta-helix repeat protein
LSRNAAFLLLIWVALSATISADEGRIPLYEPANITVPGHYVLTRDISGTTHPVLSVSAPHVTVDFNGHSITGTAASGTVVLVNPGVTGVTLRNGRISGGQYGVFYSPYLSGGRLRLGDLRIEGQSSTAMALLGHLEYVEITGCHTSAPSAVSINSDTPFGGHITDNTFRGTDFPTVNLGGMHGGTFRGNRIESTSSYDALGLEGTSGSNSVSGNRIQDNIILGGQVGINVGTYSGSNVISGNVIKEALGHGMQVVSNENRITGNTSSNNDNHGIVVFGARNLVENNALESNGGYGFWAAGLNNAYRNNFIRGNTAGSVNGTATDGGGNIL